MPLILAKSYKLLSEMQFLCRLAKLGNHSISIATIITFSPGVVIFCVLPLQALTDEHLCTWSEPIGKSLVSVLDLKPNFSSQ